MAAKRRASYQLTDRNWDQEEEPEEVGVFEKASDDVIKNRVIRTAKRRVPGGSSEEGGTKSLFSGFSGFTSSVSSNGPKSFSFLSTTKSTDTNQAGDNKSSSLSFIPSSSNLDTVKSTGDAPNKQFSFLSKSKLPNGTDVEVNRFPASFLSKTTSSTSDTNKLSFFTPDKPTNQSKEDSRPKLQELSKQLKKTDEPSIKNTTSTAANDDKTPEEIFLRKLKSLNLLCAEWILEHLNENPHYILTPVFDDYKKHLNQLQEERQAKNSSCKRAKFEMKVEAEVTAPPSTSFKAPDFKESLSKVNFGPSFFNKPLPQSQPELTFGNNETKPAYDFNKNAKLETDNIFKPTASGMFSFGSNASSLDSKTDKPAESDKPTSTSTFSFTAVDSNSQFKNPFFNATSIPTTSDSKPADNGEDNEDKPPVIEDVSITEEGSVFDKKCKVFIKKDGNYVDHGVGFLFLKLVGDDKKCQLIVRANNKLANVIINVLISSSIPLQKQGKNNVMVVCCPTPDAKAPAAVLLKVKTSEDADQLLELINKYKK